MSVSIRTPDLIREIADSKLIGYVPLCGDPDHTRSLLQACSLSLRSSMADPSLRPEDRRRVSGLILRVDEHLSGFGADPEWSRLKTTFDRMVQISG